MDRGFYIVVNATRGPSAQPMKHTTFAGAQNEARRIAAKEPDSKVYVFRSLGYAIKREADWRDHVRPPDPLDEDDIPF